MEMSGLIRRMAGLLAPLPHVDVQANLPQCAASRGLGSDLIQRLA